MQVDILILILGKTFNNDNKNVQFIDAFGRVCSSVYANAGTGFDCDYPSPDKKDWTIEDKISLICTKKEPASPDPEKTTSVPDLILYDTGADEVISNLIGLPDKAIVLGDMDAVRLIRISVLTHFQL